MQQKLTQIFEQMAGELPGYQAAAVVSRDDGLTIVEVSRQDSSETAAAAAYLASIAKSNAKAIKLLPDEQTTDAILVSTDLHYFLIYDIPGQPLFVFLMVHRDEWMGKVRMVADKFQPDLIKLLQSGIAIDD
ncbi:MAG: hypothetical protein ABFS19_06045 [Thermodesulfobacteriota bacterium]